MDGFFAFGVLAYVTVSEKLPDALAYQPILSYSLYLGAGDLVIC